MGISRIDDGDLFVVYCSMAWLVHLFHGMLSFHFMCVVSRKLN